MLLKLLSSIFQSMYAASLPSPPPEFPGPRDVDTTTVASSSLPTDLLLEIFLRLEPSDVIRCAGVCKPWRRAIVGNAASLRPRPDRFDPDLLLGVLDLSSYGARLRRMPGPFQSALPSNVVGRLSGHETVRSLMPDDAAAAAASGVDRGCLYLYRELLWSADGFILLMARTMNRLCLFNPMTGYCTFLPAAAASKCSMYILLTGRDDDAASPPAGGTGNKLAVRILAVQKRHRFMLGKEEQQGLRYQVCLLTSGAGDGDDSAAVWGPVQRSGDEHQGDLCVWMERRSTLVCRDVVYWLAGPGESPSSITCTLALDVRTGRTWTTQLPQHYYLNSRSHPNSSVPILAASSDGRLSLMASPRVQGPRIQVWVNGDGDGDGDDTRWTLQQTIAIDVGSVLLPDWDPDDPVTMLIRELVMTDLRLRAFCPRSGCVVGVCVGWELLIDIHSGRVRRIGECRGHDCHPYEMDCSSTYISKMKHF